MVLNHSCREQFPWSRPWKLKHLKLSSVYYKLLNTSYIFTYNCWKYCQCKESQGCRSKPINGIIADRNHCYICRVGVTYNEEKIRNIKKISLNHNNFLEIKKNIQLCIDFDLTCNEFWMHHYKTSYITATVNGVILNLLLMNTFMHFVLMTNNSSDNRKCLCTS